MPEERIKREDFAEKVGEISRKIVCFSRKVGKNRPKVLTFFRKGGRVQMKDPKSLLKRGFEPFVVMGEFGWRTPLFVVGARLGDDFLEGGGNTARGFLTGANR